MFDPFCMKQHCWFPFGEFRGQIDDALLQLSKKHLGVSDFQWWTKYSDPLHM